MGSNVYIWNGLRFGKNKICYRLTVTDIVSLDRQYLVK